MRVQTLAPDQLDMIFSYSEELISIATGRGNYVHGTDQTIALPGS